MKKNLGMLPATVFLCLAVCGMPAFAWEMVNGGFEAEFQGWTGNHITAYHGEYPHAVKSSYYGHRPKEGDHFAWLKGGFATGDAYYVCQEVYLNQGDELSGWILFDDVGAISQAWVQIRDRVSTHINDSVLEYEIWTADKSTNGWTRWQWQAPETGFHGLYLGITRSGGIGQDPQYPYALFDANRTAVKRPRATARFSDADLEGTWQMHFLSAGDSPQWNGYGYATFAIDDSGNYLGEVHYSDNTSENAGGSLRITDDGILSEVSIPNTHGVMNEAKNLMVFTADNGPGDYGLFVFVKADPAATFRAADFEGNWQVHFLQSGDAPQWVGYAHGTFVFDGSGNYSGTLQYSDNSSDNPEGSLTMDTPGLISSPSNPRTHGVMSDDKSLMVFTSDNGPGDYGLYVFVKRDAPGGFSTADMQGTWYPHFLSSGDAPQWIGYGFGVFEFDRSGQYTGVVKYSDYHSENPYGTFTVDGNGIIRGTAPDIHGVLSDDKQLMVFTSTSGPPGSNNLFVFVKRKRVSAGLPASLLLLDSESNPGEGTGQP